jgi:hypothetical protein
MMDVVERDDTRVITRDHVAHLVRELQKMPQTDCPVTHHFAPGVYLREIFMPAGLVVIGKIHKTEHLNIIERGRCAIRHDDGSVEVLAAPLTFVSKAGVQKVLYILEDTVWKTIHPTATRDMEQLELELIDPPPQIAFESPPVEVLTDDRSEV